MLTNIQGEIVDVDFCKSVIKSKAALEYSVAQLRIDDENDQSSLTQGIRHLNMLAKELRKSRLEKGALFLASPEVKFAVAT